MTTTDVKVLVTSRSMLPTDALKRYAEYKLYKLGKCFYCPPQVHGALPEYATRASTDRRTPEISTLTIDLVTDKIERQSRKYKTKWGQRRRDSG